MNQQQIVEFIGSHLWTLVLLLSFVIQIVPIKIYPWTSLFKWISKIILRDTNVKIDALTNNLNKLDIEVKNNEKDRIRWEILDFANSCRQGRRHTKDEFEHIISLNDKYQILLKETKDQNGVFEAEYHYITGLYNSHLENNDFL